MDVTVLDELLGTYIVIIPTGYDRLKILLIIYSRPYYKILQ